MHRHLNKARIEHLEDRFHPGAVAQPAPGWGWKGQLTHRERHDSRACGGHEGLWDFEQPPAAPAQLLPLLAPKLAVEALCYVARQLYVLLLVRACIKQPVILASACLISTAGFPGSCPC